ncbi:hypothetical protein B0T14DRAFT_274993 [Immersiella caudata]|uniref:Lysine-specific metallo-endopeptidase domain-containing protein n=1 Tax=Immersiella caudata TaxID=314043 RepID=A0AA40BY07_9PEZI|nr:hypothetical protein B0T14DRAFT_274993 [Immersiella caudata]
MIHRLFLMSLLGTCMANRWLLHESCFNDPKLETALIASFKEAIEIAQTAVDVLEKDLQNEKVQSMVRYIVGTENLEASLNVAKEYFTNVGKYKKEETTDMDLVDGDLTNQDVRVYCDGSNWGPGPSLGTLKNTETGTLKGKEEVNMFMTPCFEKERPQAGDTLAMAVTTSSNIIDMPRYRQVYDPWKAGKQKDPQPSVGPFSTVHPDNPNTMNICKWYLNAIKDTSDNKIFHGISDDAIRRVREPDFIASLGQTKPIDVLKESMGALLIHELTHTNLGGLSYDDERPPGCYGWECVGTLKNIYNADSINILAVCMFLFRNGFWVDNQGAIQTV